MSKDIDFKYGLYVMNPNFTRVKLSSNEDKRVETLEWLKSNCVGEYEIFEHYNNAFLKDEQDRMWYELRFRD